MTINNVMVNKESFDHLQHSWQRLLANANISETSEFMILRDTLVTLTEENKLSDLDWLRPYMP